jgi:uncharacterized protein (TIGR02594 family)
MSAVAAFIKSAFTKQKPADVIPIRPIENISPVKLKDPLTVALSHVGRCEGKDDQWIINLFKSTTYHTNSSSTAWCAAFVCYLMDVCRMKNTRSAAALAQSRLGLPCADDVPGAVMVWEHTDGSLKGHFHVNILIQKTGPKEWKCVGGNQGNAVSVATYGSPHYKLVSSRRPIYL